MSGLILTLTNAGRAALVNLPNTGTNAVLMASVGVSATSFTPTAATTAVPGEIKRISTIAGEAVANDTVHVTVRDESTAAYTVRSFGLYLADGTLFAVYSQATPIMEKSAQAMLLLAIDVAFADVNATQITFGDTSFLNPPATTERQGIVELATDAETSTGTDAQRAVTPKALKAAVTSWLNTRLGNGAPSDFVKGLLTSTSAALLRTSLEIKSAALKDEGAGKGLDADLVDGLHAEQFMRADTTAATAGFYNPTQASDLNDIARLSYRAVIPFNSGYQPGNRPAGNYVSGIEVGAYLDNYRWQFVAAQPAANRFFGRHLHAGVWQDWVEFWNTGNDGAGSGLDADLLDGEHGSFYRDASNLNAGTLPPARLTGSYAIDVSGTAATATKLAAARTLSLTGDVTGSANFDGSSNAAIAATFAAARVLEKLLMVDGSGSGLDADLLDGLQGEQFMRADTTAATVGFYNPTLAGDLNAVPRLSYRAVIPFNSGYQPGNRPAGNYVSGIEVGAYLDNYRWQFVAAQPAANRFFGRHLHAGTWQDWVEFWNTGNDGAGSGLDADLLDGLNASDFLRNFFGSWVADAAGNERFYFADDRTILKSPNGRITLRTSGNNTDTTYVSVAGQYYALGSLVWNAGIDGSGSGLDADLLDGQQGSYYLPASSYSATDVRAKLLTVDGSGSGVDADLLDGLQAADFAKLADFVASKTTNGYGRLPNGLILQAGRFTATNDSTVTVTFPTTFPNLCMGVVVSGTANISADAQDNNPAVRSGTVLTNQFQVFNAADTTQAFFIAIGY